VYEYWGRECRQKFYLFIIEEELFTMKEKINLEIGKDIKR